MNGVSGVIFDVDGVLLDSLEPHLQICRDKNREYGLGLAIPNADEFRKIVRRGVKISPMKFFFQAVGFPSEYADRAVEQYNMTFVRRYTIRLFPGVNEMLHHLASAGLSLGIVTSNVRANIESALGSNMRLFRPDCIFTKDTADWDSKVYALLTAAARLNVDTNKTMYVGDQPADWFAAKEAGAKFLGVSYGWGLSQEDKEFPIINNAFEIAAYILNSLGN